MAKNLFQKVWDDHVVGQLDSGQYQIFIALHLIHEVTSPQAFGMLKDKGLPVAYPDRTFATVDHIIPTDDQRRPLADEMAEKMIQVLADATDEHQVEFFAPQSGSQGIVHVVGPELGLTQPGMTICCGDSHTSTHGAFGTIALGLGFATLISSFFITVRIFLGLPRSSFSFPMSSGVSLSSFSIEVRDLSMIDCASRLAFVITSCASFEVLFRVS